MNERLAVVLEGRYRWRETDERLGTIVCESGECHPFPTNVFSSAELTGGFTYRFGDLRPFPPDPTSDGAGEDSAHRYPGIAAGEVFLGEFLPWVINRYVTEDDFAMVTEDSIKANFRTGFTYDRDSIATNQFNHPIHGSMYFSAARSNGYGFYESGAVTLLGSFLWECCAEAEPPAINDIVSTTLGGMAIGEVTHRLSSMLWAGGGDAGPPLGERIGAIVLSPIGALSRALHGEDAQLPRKESLPSRFRLDVDGGYLHVGGGAEDADRGGLAVRAQYGDPFAGEMQKPFDSFTLGVEVNAPADSMLARIEEQGILKGWELSDPKAASRYIFGLFMGYAYVNNDAETFGTQSVSAGFLSRYPAGVRLRRRGRLPGRCLPDGCAQDPRRAGRGIRARLRLRVGRRPEHRRAIEEGRRGNRDDLLRCCVDGDRERGVEDQHAPVLPGVGAAPDRGRVRRGRELLPVPPPDLLREPALPAQDPAGMGRVPQPALLERAPEGLHTAGQR